MVDGQYYMAWHWAVGKSTLPGNEPDVTTAICPLHFGYREWAIKYGIDLPRYRRQSFQSVSLHSAQLQAVRANEGHHEDVASLSSEEDQHHEV